MRTDIDWYEKAGLDLADHEAVRRHETAMLERSGPLAVGANQAIERFFATTAFDPARIPDHGARGRQYKVVAAAYRRRHDLPERTAAQAPEAGDTWTIRFRTPGGEKQAVLVLDSADGNVTGSFDGAAIEDGRIEGGLLRFTAHLTSPFKMRIKCTATVDGDTMTGRAKAPLMAIPFSGTREAG